MNRAFLKGRLTKDPQVAYTSAADPMCIARYTLAVNRTKKDEADFISCVAFGKQGEFAEKYLSKGQEILIEGHIQTGSYEKQDGTKVYTTDVVVDCHEFCSPKGSNQEDKPAADEGGFMYIPNGLEEELPFE